MFWPQTQESNPSTGCSDTKTRNIFQSYLDRSYRKIFSNLRVELVDRQPTAQAVSQMLSRVFNSYETTKILLNQSQSVLQKIGNVSRDVCFASWKPIVSYS